MRFAEFLAVRGIGQKAIYMAICRAGYHIYQPDISRMIRGKLRMYPKARAAFRAALLELYIDPKTVGTIVELKDPP